MHDYRDNIPFEAQGVDEVSPEALQRHRDRQAAEHEAAARDWEELQAWQEEQDLAREEQEAQLCKALSGRPCSCAECLNERDVEKYFYPHD